MPVSTIHGAERLTAGEAATFALIEDQARRAAMRRGDFSAAVEHKRERDRLCDLATSRM